MVAARSAHGMTFIGESSVRLITLPVAFLVLSLIFGLATPEFLSARNLSMFMIELSVTALLGVGMLLVILPGHIDLSAGSGVGLLGGIAAVLIFHGNVPAPVALLIALLVGVGIWMAMGWFIAATHIQAFVVTLGGLLVFKGMFWMIIRSTTVLIVRGDGTNLLSSLTTSYLPPNVGVALAAVLTLGIAATTFARRSRSVADARDSAELAFLKVFVVGQTLFLIVLACNEHRGVPAAFLILCGIACIVHVLTQQTPFGRYLYAIGGNYKAAVLSGIPVVRVIVTAFGILGAIVALTGFMQTSYAGASTVSVGELMELDAIAACVIGGTSLKGGRGTVVGTLFGAAIMSLLLNGMTLLAVTPETKYIVRGVVLVLAVLLDIATSRKHQ